MELYNKNLCDYRVNSLILAKSLTILIEYMLMLDI